MKKVEQNKSDQKRDFLSPSTQKNPRGTPLPPPFTESTLQKSTLKSNKETPRKEDPYNFSKELFQLFDHENKGFIDILEVKRLLGIFKSSIPPAMASRIIAEVDANGDGKIDFSGILGNI